MIYCSQVSIVQLLKQRTRIMACLMNLLDTLKIPCPWKCCEISKNSNVNSTVFWNNLNRQFWKPKNEVFFNEKKFTLSDECALVVGASPEDQFKPIGRLEITWNNSIILYPEELLNFINSVEEEFQPNELYPTYNEGHADNNNRANHIQILALEQKLYKIKVGVKQMKLDEKILFGLSQKALMIKSFIKILDSNRKKYESYLLKLLHHFCQNKSQDESLNLSNTIYMHHFFEECHIFHCDCIDKTFIIELALNFTNWFIHCIPSFIKTIMVCESARLATFSDSWPNEKSVDINTMAKSGLYFTGVLDCVECAFCNAKIHKWERDDDPVAEHYKYSCYCPLLWRPKETANIATGCQSELLALLSASTKNASSFDVIDSKNDYQI